MSIVVPLLGRRSVANVDDTLEGRFWPGSVGRYIPDVFRRLRFLILPCSTRRHDGSLGIGLGLKKRRGCNLGFSDSFRIPITNRFWLLMGLRLRMNLRRGLICSVRGSPSGCWMTLSMLSGRLEIRIRTRKNLPFASIIGGSEIRLRNATVMPNAHR